MRKLPSRSVILMVSALAALVLTLPRPSFADPDRYGNHGWGAVDPSTPPSYGHAANRSSYAEGEGDGWGNWRGREQERNEFDQANAAQRRDWGRLQQERREMNDARRAGDWQEYQHERQEAEQAANALRHDHAQVQHERRELWQHQHRWHHHRHGDED